MKNKEDLPKLKANYSVHKLGHKRLLTLAVIITKTPDGRSMVTIGHTLKLPTDKVWKDTSEDHMIDPRDIAYGRAIKNPVITYSSKMYIPISRVKELTEEAVTLFSDENLAKVVPLGKKACKTLSA